MPNPSIERTATPPLIQHVRPRDTLRFINAPQIWACVLKGSSMKEKYKKCNDWYGALNKKQRMIIWGLTVPYAVFPLTGVLLGGIPWALLLLYMEFHRNGEIGSKE